MGVGILVSGVLVLAELLHRMVPVTGKRRRRDVVAGALGVVQGAAAVAHVSVTGPDLRRRLWRSRWTYLAVATLGTGFAVSALTAALRVWNDELSVFYRNPWIMVIGVAGAVVFGLMALVGLLLAVFYIRSVRPAHILVERTVLGRMAPLPDSPLSFAHALTISTMEDRE
jgi:hypothetical protein